MSAKLFWKNPIVKGIRFGFLSLLFSYIPTLIVCMFYRLQFSIWPPFKSFFVSGSMISIWIPIVVMLVFSFYELRPYSVYPGWSSFFHFLAIILLTVFSAFYPAFYFEYVSYSEWLKWLSYGVIIVLFIALSFSKYLDSQPPKDLQAIRADDQDNLENKANKL